MCLPAQVTVISITFAHALFAATCDAESGSPLAGYRLVRAVAQIEATSADCAWIMGNLEVIRARSQFLGDNKS